MPSKQKLDVGESGHKGIGFVLGLWLTGVFAIPLLARLYLGVHFSSPSSIYVNSSAEDSRAIAAVLVFSVLWPVVFFAISGYRFLPKSMPLSRHIALWLFSLFSVLSIFVSPVMFQSTAYFCATLAGILIALQFNSNMSERQLELGLKIYVLLTVCALVAFAWYDYMPGIRLGNGKNVLNPNAISIVAFSAAIFAYVFRSLTVRLVLMFAASSVIVLTSSRASILALAVGLVIVFLMRLKSVGPFAKGGVVTAVVAVAVILAGISDVWLEYVDDYFALTDIHRGIVSGASGRLQVWRESWELFSQNPVIGVGFRAHEHVISTQTSAHNGYLAMLVEIGLVGALAIIYLVLAGVINLWRMVRDEHLPRLSNVLFGFCVGYMILALFERYLINIGNPTSLLFLMAVLQYGGPRGKQARNQ